MNFEIFLYMYSQAFFLDIFPRGSDFLKVHKLSFFGILAQFFRDFAQFFSKFAQFFRKFLSFLGNLQIFGIFRHFYLKNQSFCLNSRKLTVKQSKCGVQIAIFAQNQGAQKSKNVHNLSFLKICSVFPKNRPQFSETELSFPKKCPKKPATYAKHKTTHNKK